MALAEVQEIKSQNQIEEELKPKGVYELEIDRERERESSWSRKTKQREFRRNTVKMANKPLGVYEGVSEDGRN